MSLALIGGGGIGWTEALIVLALVLLLFGAKRIPDLARSLGKSLGEFKKGREEGMKQDGDKPDQNAGNPESGAPKLQ